MTAAAAGMPKEQLTNFLSVGYVPLPWQCRFHAAARVADKDGGPDAVGCGGARGPGKSTAVFAQLALDDARRVPGFKALFLRKALKQGREQFDELVRKVLRNVEYKYNRNEGWIRLWDESRIYLGHFHSESEIENYLGLEYDAVAIEEATTLTLSKRRAVRDSMRTSKVGWRPREYNSTNPGGVGHAWYKALFVAPFRDRCEVGTRFIPATVDDNPLVDGDYRKRLGENTGWRLRAYRFGDWEIAAGQYFSNWRFDVHVKEFAVQDAWRKWGALDYGFNHPFAWGLFAQDGDGHVYVVDELRERKLLPKQQAELIKGRLQTHNVGGPWLTWAGHDVFAQKGQDARTIAVQYAENGLALQHANIDRVNGAARILQLLGDVERGIVPRITIHPRCKRLIETLPVMEHDPNRPEDVLKVDVDEDGNGGDDMYDMLRYGVMGAPGVFDYKGSRRGGNVG